MDLIYIYAIQFFKSLPGEMDLLESEPWSPFIILGGHASHFKTNILQERKWNSFYKINRRAYISMEQVKIVQNIIYIYQITNSIWLSYVDLKQNSHCGFILISWLLSHTQGGWGYLPLWRGPSHFWWFDGSAQRWTQPWPDQICDFYQ